MKTRREIFAGYLLILPTVIVLIAIIFFPMIKSFILSFYNQSFVNPVAEFVGFSNYLKIIKDNTFWKILSNSLIYTSTVVFFQFFLGLTMALLINRQIKFKTFTRSMVLLPWVIPGVVAAIIWKLMLDPQLGIINSFLLRAGIINNYIPWLADPKLAMLVIIIISIWKGFPFSTIMYLAALQSVDKELTEAALIDGANYFQRLIKVVLPQISSIIRLAIFLTTVWTFNYFDIIYVTTNGGPLNSTKTIPIEIYNQAFKQAQFSSASAYSVVSILILLIFSILYIRELNRRGII